MIEIVETSGSLSVGGSCAECGEPYSAVGYEGVNATRCLVRYDGVVEPMNICDECLEVVA